MAAGRCLLAIVACIALSPGLACNAIADIPDETYEALGVDKGGDPAEFYDALEFRYHDPAEGAGEGSLADYWDPIPFSKYTNPTSFYEPPVKGKGSDRKGCVECHEKDTAGHVTAWRMSAHANLSQIRNYAPGDPRYYQKDKLKRIETNLVALGLLDEGQLLVDVTCMDCHVEILRVGQADHKKDLRLPDAAVCGACHLQEFAERESERDTLVWPQGQWPAGRPSHALDYHAVVEMAMWAAISEREIAEGCLSCHANQNKCDGCHTRHLFSAAEARKPEACGTCHNGIAHNEFENFMMSKHGSIYRAAGHEWNWDMRLEEAYSKNGQTAPTCATCHFEFKGKFGHNVVRKVRWASSPTPDIADNLGDGWFTARKEAWVATCTKCHAESFARAYLEMVDNGTTSGLRVRQEAKHVLDKLYQDGLLVGQTSNRPMPPDPETDATGAFFQGFIAKGNNPTAVEIEYARNCQYDLNKLYKGLAHANPGGWAYSEGWSPLVECYARIMDADTQLREMADMRVKLAAIEDRVKLGSLDLDGGIEKAAVAGLGGVMMLVGGLGLARRRRAANPPERSGPDTD
jgi:hydroxylamine dehydrogenase